MALFNKKKTGDANAASTPISAAPADVSGDTSTVVDDFSDFSTDAVQAASTPANGATNGKAKRVKAPKPDKPAAPRGPKGLKNGSFIGLNIGGDSIKVIEAGAKNGVLSVSGMGMVPTPADSISNGVVMSVNALAGAIREAMNQAGIKSKRVVTSVSGTGALVVRIIEVPKMSDGELEDNMKMDADRYIPFPPSEVIMDFKALRDLPSDPDAMNMEVLLAAAQREIIDLHIQVLQDAKLDPRAIDVEPLAAARALTHPLTTGGDINAEPDYNDVAAILNIGASGTEISILRGDILVFTRSVPSGGNALTQAISDTLGLAWHDAEGLKRDMGDALAPNESAAATANAAGFSAPASTSANGDDWTEFDMNDAAAGSVAANGDASAPVFDADDASTPATDAMMETGAPAASDPFEDAFFEQGPQADSGQVTLGDEPFQAEPGEQQQQKENEEDTDDAEAKNLPTREGEVASTEAVTGASAVDAVESSVLPTKGADAQNVSTPTPGAAAPPAAASTPAEGGSAPANAQSMQAQNAQTAAAMPAELRALFNFEEVEDPDEELPTAEDGKPIDINSLLGEEEDDLSDLPTLVSDAPAPAPMASAFDFPVATGAGVGGAAAGVLGAAGENDDALPTRAGGAASTESVSGSDAIDAGEASLLPTATAGAIAANPFAFQSDPSVAPASDTTAPVAQTPVAQTPAAVDFNLNPQPTAASTPASTPTLADDPFAAFDLSGAAPGAAPPATAAAATTAATSAADDFDLDSLFGGPPSTPTTPAASTGEAAAAGAAPADAGMSALDVLGDDVLGGATDFGAGDFGVTDFGASDFSSFGAGLGGASAGEIDAQTLHGIVGPALDTLIAEVRRSLEYHTTRYPDAAVRRITLVGGGAKLKNIDAYFTQSLGIPTSVGNPLSRLPINAPKLPPGYADENGPLFAVALGLAMRELMR